MTQASLRQTLRQQRQALSPAAQADAAENLVRQLCRLQQFQNAKRIAFYLANDGELDLALALSLAQKASKRCYLPALHPLKFNRLYFAHYRDDSSLINNRFGIPEPSLANSQLAAPWSLDMILMPLVGFDSQCNRIGMGGGFYDRTLAFKRQVAHSRPLLVGIAHQLQQVHHIETNSWDIPLDMVITDQQIFRRNTTGNH